MIEENNCCVCCGAIIPEGRMCCSRCYDDYEQMKAIKEYKMRKEAKKRRNKEILQKIKNKIPLLGG